jgi:hypothetical protein
MLKKKEAVVCLRLEDQLPLQFGIAGLQTHPIKFIRVNPVCVSMIPQSQYEAKAEQMYLHLHSVPLQLNGKLCSA